MGGRMRRGSMHLSTRGVGGELSEGSQLPSKNDVTRTTYDDRAVKRTRSTEPSSGSELKRVDFSKEGDHIAKLLEFARRPGADRWDIVRDWNVWVAEERKKHPLNVSEMSRRGIPGDDLQRDGFRPDLRRLDASAELWKTTPLVHELHIITKKFERHIALDLEGIDFRDAILLDAKLDGASLWSADLEGAKLWNASLKGTWLCGGKLKGAEFYDAHLEEANLWEADAEGTGFRGAYLIEANCFRAVLKEADFFRCDLSGVDFRLSQIPFADMDEAYYRAYRGWPLDMFPFNQGFWPFKRNLMLGKYLGIRGLESCYGSPGFRRDALDQQFIDDKFEKVKLITDFGVRYIRSRWFGWLLNSRPIRLIRELMSLPWRLHWLRIPGRLAFALWGFFDFGRSLLSLLIFASLIIFALGSWYQHLAVTHDVSFTGNLSAAGADDALLRYLRPWFAALMGFATLGLTDMIQSNTRWGALAMALNVLAGFSTLGLFLAVFQNKFARRS